MDKRQTIERVAETEEDRELLARVWDRLTGGARKNIPAATSFLSAREQILVRRLPLGLDPHFFGGFEGAERAVACFVPDYCDPEDYLHGEDGPVRALRASFYEGDSLSHRDLLGALMGSGIKRETVGDILVRPGQCDFLVTREIEPYVLQNLASAGRTKLRLAPLPFAELAPPEVRVREIRDTVAALRLDSVAASGFGLSRARAAQAIESGRAAVNHMTCEKPDRLLREGDQVSIRGLGKLELAEVGGVTKKGRTGIVIRRFV